MRKSRPSCACYSIYVRSCERHARELAAEISSWPEPIDVIRAALGLPERWQLRARRAAAEARAALVGVPYSHLDFGGLMSALIGPEECPRHA